MAKVSTHPAFQQRLLDSDEAVVAVSLWAHRRSFWVTWPPLRIARTIDQRGEYADPGDFFLGKTADERLRCDVKELLSTTFTGLHDFRHPVMFVMTLDQWERADPKPTWVFIVSHGRKHMGVLASSRWKQWKVVEGGDAFYDRSSVRYMAAPLGLVKWYALDDAKPALKLMVETTNSPPPDLTAAPLILPRRTKIIPAGQGELWSA